jgi:hypothetical protein
VHAQNSPLDTVQNESSPILCSHVRSKTSETEYQKTHKERPSNEIQTTLNLLFKEHKRSLYAQDFTKVWISWFFKRL